MKKLTFKFKTGKVSKNNETTVYLYLYYNKNSKCINTKVSCPVNCFDSLSQKIIKNSNLNKIILDRKNKDLQYIANRTRSFIEENTEFIKQNFSTLTLENILNSDTIIFYEKAYEKVKSLSLSHETMRTTYSILNDFNSIDKNICISDINYEKVFSYIKYKQNQNCCDNTIISKLKKLKVLFDNINTEYNLDLINPFESILKNKILKKPKKINKKVIDNNEIIKLFTTLDNEELDYYRQTFLFMITAGSIRFRDLCVLKKCDVDIKNNKIYMIESKTENNSTRYISENSRGFIEKIINKNTGEFLFDFLNKPNLNSEELEKKIASSNTIFNRKLKIISEKLELSTPLTTHMNRNIFANLATFEFGYDVFKTQKMMNHSNVESTMQYINNSHQLIDKEHLNFNNKLDEYIKQKGSI